MDDRLPVADSDAMTRMVRLMSLRGSWLTCKSLRLRAETDSDVTAMPGTGPGERSALSQSHPTPFLR
eukprot:65419-Rhodomonas_salina.1